MLPAIQQQLGLLAPPDRIMPEVKNELEVTHNGDLADSTYPFPQ
jgi:hypothetical protein